MARVTVLALGSRGDVQPFVALGAELQALGHHVCVAAAADYQALAEQAGLEFAPVVGYIREVMDFDLVYEALDAARGVLPLGFARRFLEHVGPLVERIVADCWRASQGADALIVSTLGCYPGLSIAERLGVPLIPAHMHPFGSTRAFPDLSFAPLPPWLAGRELYNLLTHALSAHGLWQLLRPTLNHARQSTLGLPPLSAGALAKRVRSEPALVLHGYSTHIAPRPNDWDARQHVTGYWFSTRAEPWQPPAALADFLESGPPPVYVGFGSILAGRDPDSVSMLLFDALKRAGQRGIIFRGWGDLVNIPLPDHVCAIEATPHEWLFPRVAAVVTHGGAGTVAAALRAGKSPLVVPFFGDQRFWAGRVAALGAGPPPLPRAQLSAPCLAAGISVAANNRAMHERARALGRLLEAEQGACRAAQVVSNFLEGQTT